MIVVSIEHRDGTAPLTLINPDKIPKIATDGGKLPMAKGKKEYRSMEEKEMAVEQSKKLKEGTENPEDEKVRATDSEGSRSTGEQTVSGETSAERVIASIQTGDEEKRKEQKKRELESQEIRVEKGPGGKGPARRRKRDLLSWIQPKGSKRGPDMYDPQVSKSRHSKQGRIIILTGLHLNLYTGLIRHRIHRSISEEDSS